MLVKVLRRLAERLFPKKLTGRLRKARTTPLSLESLEDRVVPSTVQIVDNANNGPGAVYSAAGSWRNSAAGFGGSEQFTSRSGGVASTASWSATVQPGTYNVFATWNPSASPASTAAPYSVFDTSKLLNTVSVNQTNAPFGLRDQGVSWQWLGTFTVQTNSLAVQLTSNGTTTVIADAIRIASAGPLPQVFDGTTAVVNGGSDSFGTTTLGQPLTKTFTVANNGNLPLTLSSLVLPSGYSLVAPFGARTVAAGGSTAFSVRLAAASAGNYNGTASFTTNDLGAPKYTIAVSGTVSAGPVAQVFDGTTAVVNGGNDSFGDTLAGQALAKTFTVKNVGSQSLSLGALVLPSGYSLVTPFGSTTVAAGASTSFTVSLTAAAVGSYSGTVSFATNSHNAPTYNIAVSGTVNAGPVAQVLDGTTAVVNGGSDSFGTTTIGQALAKTFTVKNVGSQSLSLSALVLPSGYSLVTPFGSTTLAAGASTSFSIGLTAAAAGNYTGSVSFTTNNPNAPTYNFTVGGKVNVGPLAQVFDGTTALASGGSDSFGPTLVGQAQTKTFTVKDVGDQPLTLSSLVLPSGFSLAAPFGSTTVAVGATTSFNVSLTAAAAGNYSGTLSFATNNFNAATYSITVGGTVNIGPVAQVFDGTTAVVNGGSDSFGTTTIGQALAKSFTVKNVGDLPLTLSTLVLPSGYSLVTSFGTTTVAAGASTSFTVSLTAAAVGNYSGAVSFTTNNLNATTYNFTVGGTVNSGPVAQVFDGTTAVVNGGNVVFGSTLVGQGLAKTFTVKNVGDQPLTLSSLVLPSGFSLATPFGVTTVAAGASTSFSVSLAAAAAGNFSGIVSFATNNLNAATYAFAVGGTVYVGPVAQVFDGTTAVLNSGSVIVPPVIFGPTLVGQPMAKTFTVKNVGDLPLTLSSLIVQTGYSLTTPFGSATVAAGASTSFTVRLDAAAAGIYSGTVSFTTNSLNASTYIFNVEGAVNVGPVAQVFDGTTAVVNGGSVTFGPTLVGQVLPKTFTVKNVGDLPLTLSSLVLPSGYSLVTSFGNTAVAAGASTSFSVRLTAAATGTYSGTVSFATNNLNALTYSFIVGGSVYVGPVVQVLDGTTAVVSGGSDSFGTTTLFQAVTKTFTIKNVGDLPLSLSSLVLPSGFSLATSFGSTTVAAGASTSFSVSLNTAFTNTYTGTLSFATNQPSASPYQFAINGVVNAVIIDTFDSRYSETGNWNYGSYGYGGGANYTLGAGTGQSLARWAASILPGTYEVWAEWYNGGPRATDAPYTIYDGNTAVATVRVDQHQAPLGITINGFVFQELGVFAFQTKQLTVALSDDADNTVLADSIRFQDAAGAPTSPALTITGMPDSGHWPEGSPVTLGSKVIQPSANGHFQYAWTATKNGAPFATGTNSTFTFTPDDVGSYQISLTVTDPLGAHATDSRALTVDNLPPSVTTGPASGKAHWVVNFAAAGTDPGPIDAANLSYNWTFGDGGTGTGIAPTHVYANAGTYTVIVTVTDPHGASSSAHTTASISSLGPAADYIVTAYDNIPNFGFNPTITSIKSGAWSDPTIWSLGRLPTAGDVVSITANSTVIYDLVSTASVTTVAIQAGSELDFRTDVSTTLTVSNLLVMAGATLQIGTAANPVATNVKAQVIFPDVSLNTALDPEQFGNGLIALGTVNIHGAPLNQTFVELAAAPRAGDTTLTLTQPVSGWQVGDKLVLPDSRQLGNGNQGVAYQSEIENPIIAAISSDGLTITLNSLLQFDHPGAQNYGDGLMLNPDVADRSRNVSIKSANSRGNRGYVLFTAYANVDVEYAALLGIGRTTDDATDNTTFDAQGNVIHVGTNENDRNPVTFRNLVGPATPQADGYQFTFIGNYVHCTVEPMNFRWGITIDNSSYGLIKDNISDNWAGAGIITESGSEIHNRIDHNLVVDISGNSDKSSMGRGGDGFWFRNPDNFVVNNVATDINPAGGLDDFGFTFYVQGLGNQKVPAYQGADPSVAGQSVVIDMTHTPLLDFSGNQVYGATPGGLTMWELGTSSDVPDGKDVVGPSVVKNFTAWNIHNLGLYGYKMANVTFDHFVVRDNSVQLQDSYYDPTGIYFGDYSSVSTTVVNADIRGMRYGLDVPNVTWGVTTVADSYFSNVVDIFVGTPWSVNGGGSILPRTTVIRNCTFAALAGYTHSAIAMTFDMREQRNTVQLDQVFVYDFNGVSGDNFQVYYLEQDANFIVPQTSPDGRLVGSPDAGLTNQQNWVKHHIAVAGAIAPLTAGTRAGITGLVSPL